MKAQLNRIHAILDQHITTRPKGEAAYRTQAIAQAKTLVAQLLPTVPDDAAPTTVEERNALGVILDAEMERLASLTDPVSERRMAMCRRLRSKLVFA